RAAPRLGYAIEVLASDAESLAAAVPVHVPDGITTSTTTTELLNDDKDNDEKKKKKGGDDDNPNEIPKIVHSGEEDEEKNKEEEKKGRGRKEKMEPEPHLDRLRTLQRVRKHLDSVQRTFALALDFSPFPPSLLLSSSSSSLIGTSFIITSPPSSSLQQQQQQTETTGQAALGKLKAEVLALVVHEEEVLGWSVVGLIE
ncbi:MAG: hypothetical protein Q9197_005027, partial [Variospora fuerteventurae]